MLCYRSYLFNQPDHNNTHHRFEDIEAEQHGDQRPVKDNLNEEAGEPCHQPGVINGCHKRRNDAANAGGCEGDGRDLQ